MTKVVSFTQADIKRAVNGARTAGLDVGAVEVRRDGSIRIVTASAVKTELDPFEEFERDEEKHS